MFKSLVGKGHPEFSTKRQQDAQEFLLHLFSMIEVTWLIYMMNDNGVFFMYSRSTKLICM